MCHWPLFNDEDTFHRERGLRGGFSRPGFCQLQKPCSVFSTGLSLPDLSTWWNTESGLPFMCPITDNSKDQRRKSCKSSLWLLPWKNMFSQLQNAVSRHSPFISKSISPKFHNKNTLSQTVLRGLTVKLGYIFFSFLQEGFYIFSQAFPRLSFSHTIWRLSSVGDWKRLSLRRSHRERCERVFLSEEISISIGLAEGAAFASSLCGVSCVQSENIETRIYTYIYIYMLIGYYRSQLIAAVLLPHIGKNWIFLGLLSCSTAF